MLKARILPPKVGGWRCLLEERTGETHEAQKELELGESHPRME